MRPLTWYKVISAALFITAEIILGYMLQTAPDIDDANLYRFVSVVLATLFCFLHLSFSKQYLFIQAGLLFTICADWHLVMMNPIQQLEGMEYFCLVQICYCILLCTNHKSKRALMWHLLIRLTVCALAILATRIVLGDATDPLSLISLFYYANIILNLIFSITQIKKSIILPLALALFLCCDTIIGLEIMSQSYIQGVNDTGILSLIRSAGFDVAWAFYLPSQMLIPLSLLEMRARRKRRLKLQGGK